MYSQYICVQVYSLLNNISVDHKNGEKTAWFHFLLINRNLHFWKFLFSSVFIFSLFFLLVLTRKSFFVLLTHFHWICIRKDNYLSRVSQLIAFLMSWSLSSMSSKSSKSSKLKRSPPTHSKKIFRKEKQIVCFQI